MLCVNFNTGAGNQEVETIEEAKEIAVNECTYTQQSITITENGELVARLPWNPVKATKEDIVLADFNEYGFYGEWQYDF